MPPRKAKDEDDLPDSSSEDEDIEAALLASKGPPSDAPAAAPAALTPREKMRQRGKATPLTPRSAQKALEDAAEDPAAAAAAAAKAIEDADPAAAAAMAAAKAAAEDPEAAAKAALEAAKNYKPPTAEELKRTRDGAVAEIAAAKAAALKLWEDMINDRPPPCWPLRTPLVATEPTHRAPLRRWSADVAHAIVLSSRQPSCPHG
jgi:hypothetical protein